MVHERIAVETPSEYGISTSTNVSRLSVAWLGELGEIKIKKIF